MEGSYHRPSTGTPAISKYSSNFAFVMEIKFVGGEYLQPCDLRCVFMERLFFQKLCFLLQNCFHGTFPSGHALLSPQLSRDWQFVTEFLSQIFFRRVFITGFLSQGFFHSGHKQSRNCDQGGGFYFSFMPKGRSWKMLKNGLSTILAIFSSQN